MNSWAVALSVCAVVLALCSLAVALATEMRLNRAEERPSPGSDPSSSSGYVGPWGET
jgi:hypothetical protein